MVVLKGYPSILIGRRFEEPKIQDFPFVSYKYSDIDFVYKRTTDYVRDILDNISIVGNRNYVLVDVKVHDLDIGVLPALAGWHTDCVDDLRSPVPEETHHLFVSGTGCLTEFLPYDVKLDSYDNLEEVLDSLEGKALPSNTICTVGRMYHRAVPSSKKFRRLLVRVTESDCVRPNNKEFKVTYTKVKK